MRARGSTIGRAGGLAATTRGGSPGHDPHSRTSSDGGDPCDDPAVPTTAPTDDQPRRARHAADPAPPTTPGWFDLVVAAGRGAVYLVWLALAVVCVPIGVAAAHDADEPRTWGTFTEEHREWAGRGGDHVTGRWTSDDGRTVLEDVDLDGFVTEDGTVRAYVRPTSVLGGDDIVHDGTSDGFAPLVAPAVGVFCLGGLVVTAWRWGDVARVHTWWTRRAAAAR